MSKLHVDFIVSSPLLSYFNLPAVPALRFRQFPFFPGLSQPIMSYLSSFKDTQHYEGTGSIPPFEMCVPTSPQPRVLSLHTLLGNWFYCHMLTSSFPTKTMFSQIAALRSCPTPLFVNHSLSFTTLLQYLISDHVYVSPLLQTYATHRWRAGKQGAR